MKGYQIFVALVITFVWLSNSQGQEPNYSGVAVCQVCHSENGPGPNIFPFWAETRHAVAYDSVAAFSAFLRSQVQRTSECLECHTTGWDTTKANMGADDFVVIDPDTEGATFNISFASEADSLEFLKKKNVQCESCHGPASDHVADFMNIHPITDVTAEACGECHQDKHHPYIEEWRQAAHATSDSSKNPFVPSSRFREDPNCSGCHTFQGFLQFVGTTAADTANIEPDIAEPPGDDALPLVCAACHDPHDARHEGQLRLPPVNLCAKCHNPEDAQPPDNPHHSTDSMFEGMGAFEFPGVEYTRQSVHQLLAPISEVKCIACHVFMTPFEEGPPEEPAVTGHTFEPRIEACMQAGCHVNGLEIPPDSQLEFDHRGRRTFTQNLIDSLAAIIADIEANVLPTASPEDSADYQIGLFNLRFAQNEGSVGVHNPEYAQDILESTIAFLDTAIVTAIEPRPGELEGIPTTFELYQNYPNPFNPTTKIRFDVPKASHVKLIIYNALGQEVETLVDKKLGASSYEVEFNATNLSSGLYFYKLVTDSFVSTKKMLLLK